MVLFLEAHGRLFVFLIKPGPPPYEVAWILCFGTWVQILTTFHPFGGLESKMCTALRRPVLTQQCQPLL